MVYTLNHKYCVISKVRYASTGYYVHKILIGELTKETAAQLHFDTEYGKRRVFKKNIVRTIDTSFIDNCNTQFFIDRVEDALK